MEDLPEEILMQMFKHLLPADLLLRARLVCKTWNRLSKDPILWNERELSYRSCTDEDFAKCLRLIPQISTLDLTELTGRTAENHLLKMPTKVPNLIIGDEIDIHLALKVIAWHGHDLQNLTVGRLAMTRSQYKKLMILIDTLALKSLNLSATCRNYEWVEIHDFSHGDADHRTLERLEVWGEEDMPLITIAKLIGAHKKSLKHVSHEFVSKKPSEPQDRNINNAITLCENIQEVRGWSTRLMVLTMSDVETITSFSLICDGECNTEGSDTIACDYLFTRSNLLPRLKKLCLRHHECPSCDPLPCIEQRCPNLVELSIRCSAVSNSRLNVSLEVLRNLKSLTLIGAHYLHPNIVKAWTRDTAPNLMKLHLIGTARFCPWVCWAQTIKKLRDDRPWLDVRLKHCTHFKAKQFWTCALPGDNDNDEDVAAALDRAQNLELNGII